MEVSQKIIELRSIGKSFAQASGVYKIFEDINFIVHSGEIVSIVGYSGSGKSTLLYILGLLDFPTYGEVIVNGINTASLNDDQLTDLRKKYLGFVYQHHHLLPEFSAIENLKITKMIDDGISSDKGLIELLSKFGLAEKAKNYPSQLSGGERQRVAIARAIVNKPKAILADEPTGNLDQKNAAVVLDFFLENVKRENIAAIIVTHNMDLAKRTDKVFVLANGRLELA